LVYNLVDLTYTIMYLPVVGLEIHLQVKTNSKMFCRCASQYFESEPNTHVCPVCFGLPGALPVPNKEAFNKALKLAIALNCTINKETKFDRKNYFYPDLPKGYQISQYDQPIGENGFVEIEVMGDSRRIRIQRLHLEEDTAKSLHAENDDTLIDYNKSGVPLIEIVTYPDFESVEEVILFSKRLKQIVKYLDISGAEMQKGQMRFELNISVKPDSMPAGQLPDYKVEVKNIGSISVLEKVLNFEVQRQSELLDKAEKIKSQTRGLKGMSGETLFQRSKETADDYRYFPEPDIPPIHISDAQIQELTNSIPELPHERKQRYMDVGLESEQADIFVDDRTKGDWFDELLKLDSQKELVKEAAKWVVGEISGRLEKLNKEIDQINLTQQDLLEIVQLLAQKKISGIGVKKLIEARLVEENNTKKSINDLVTELGLVQITDSSEVENFAKQAIEQNPKLVADLAKNPNVIKALVGQVMKLSQGKVNPRIAEEELRKLLNN